MGKLVFRKKERLSREAWIQQLFARGSAFQTYPIRVLFMPHPQVDAQVNQVMLSVSKRSFKRAVDRNKIKRRMREAYRLNKFILDTSEKWLIAYIYIAKEVFPSSILQDRIKAALSKIRDREYEKK